jgi:hypothetical protein
LGTIDWYALDGYFYSTLPLIKNNAGWGVVPNLVCSKYRTVMPNDVANLVADDTISVWPSGTRVVVMDTSYTDAATFKAAMSGVMLVYELATPTTEQAASYPEVQVVDDFGTERFVDTRPVAIPVGHSTKYMSNLRDKLQHLPDLAASDGLYMVRQANGQMTLTPSPLPATPSQNGTYTLKCTVSNGTPTYSWEAQS